ncbi:MAG TPA: hypothetical protein VGF98_02205 [Candidatus Tumulicola sp.]
MQHVVVQSMPPEAVKSMPAVVIKGSPSVVIDHIKGELDPRLTFWGPAILALIAIVVALITLNKVLAQIKLAKEQLEVANQELSAVKADFKLSQEQFKLAQEQFAMIKRAPNLEVEFIGGSETRQLVNATDPYSAYREFAVNIYIRNIGTRVSRGVEMHCYVPKAALCAEVLIQRTYRARVIAGVEYVAFEALSLKRLHQDEEFSKVYRMEFDKSVTDVTILWRVWEDDYAFPSERYGEQHYEFRSFIA